MKLVRTYFAHAVYIALLASAITDAVMYCYISRLRKLDLTSGVIITNPMSQDAYLPPNGYTADGERVSAQKVFATGWAVHFSSPRCEYSRSDFAQWNTLRSHLTKKRYHIFEMTPSAVEAYPNNAPELRDESQIIFVDVEWMKRYRFKGTPTTLIFNSHGLLVWSYEGVLDNEAVESAFRHSS